jgi:hypothetical protein
MPGRYEEGKTNGAAQTLELAGWPMRGLAALHQPEQSNTGFEMKKVM